MGTKTKDKPITDAEGKALLKEVLLRMRWDDQGGFPSYHNGKWGFISTGLPQVSPEELDRLLEFAGIVPDEIVSIGDCKTCKFAVDRGNGPSERGWSAPCVSCKRPQMSNYEPYTGDPTAVCAATVREAPCGERDRHPLHAEGADFHHKFRKG